MSTIELTTDNFDDVIQGNDIVIVDFWASWCGPCKMFAPVFEAAAAKHTDITFAKVNTEKQQAIAAGFQIRSIPTLMIFKDQIVVFSQPGALPASALETLIQGARDLDMVKVRESIQEKQNADSAPDAGPVQS